VALLAVWLCASCAASASGSTMQVAGGAGSAAVAPIAGLTSGATCASGSTLTYTNFARNFMATYCLRCHTASIVGSARQAPPDRNFDDLTSIRSLAHPIDQQAGAGPAATHLTMPPNGAAPTITERMQLSQWLACGAPQ
jgi:hypothetical protein